jgi:hypothetical protein
VTSVRRPPRLRLALAPLLLATLVSGAACSSGGGGPTQDQYAAVADELCAGTEERLAELQQQHDEEVYIAAATGESGTYVDRPERWVRAKIVPEYRKLSGNLKGIQPPDGDVAYLTDLYADLDARIETLHRRPGDGRAVINGDSLLKERFASYGITECPV